MKTRCKWLSPQLVEFDVSIAITYTSIGAEVVARWADNEAHMRVLRTVRGIALYWGSVVSRRKGWDVTVGEALDWLAHQYGMALVDPTTPPLFTLSRDRNPNT